MTLKLARLKTWLSCEDAASNLATLLNEPVTVTDILQLALEGQLQLSIYFPTAQPALAMRVVPKETAKKLNVYLPPAASHDDENFDPEIERLRGLLENQGSGLDSLDFYALFRYLQTDVATANKPNATKLYPLYLGTPLDPFAILEENGPILDIRGYWNLDLIGGSMTAIQNQYFGQIDANANDEISWSGIILRAPDDKDCWMALKRYIAPLSDETFKEISDIHGKAGWSAPPSLWKEKHVDKADGFPENSRIFVRTSELQRFLQSLETVTRAGVTAKDEQDESSSEETELQRTQRSLAALALGLAAKIGTYGKTGKPNVSQLAKLATEHLRDGQNDRAPHGFSESTVRQTITDALKACPELKE